MNTMYKTKLCRLDKVLIEVKLNNPNKNILFNRQEA